MRGNKKLKKKNHDFSTAISLKSAYIHEFHFTPNSAGCIFWLEINQRKKFEKELFPVLQVVTYNFYIITGRKTLTF